MSATVEQLLEAALELPTADRIELTEALMASIETSEPPPLDDKWKAIVMRRGEEVLQRKVALIPWSEVQKKGREIVGD